MAPPQSAQKNLKMAIAECLAQAQTTQQAASLLEARVRASRELRDALTEDLIARACLDVVSTANRNYTKVAWDGGSFASTSITRPSTTQQAKVNARRAVAYSGALLSMIRLPGGRMLKDSSYQEVLEAAEFFGKQGRNMLHKERWLHAIARAMDRKKVVGSSLDEVALRRLEDETQQKETADA